MPVIEIIVTQATITATSFLLTVLLDSYDGKQKTCSCNTTGAGARMGKYNFNYGRFISHL